MNKLSVIMKMLLFVAMMACWSSCSKSESSDEEKSDDFYLEVCEHVVDVANSVDAYFYESTSMEEMSTHLDEIKKLDYVEDAYVSNTTMCVKIKDFGTLMYSFFAQPEAIFIDLDNPTISSRKKASSLELVDHPFLEAKNICIANAQNIEYLIDNKMQDRKLLSEELTNAFEYMGYQVDYYTAPNLFFFSNTMFNYDIVYLITHGSYDKKTGLHWIIGSEPIQLDPETIRKVKEYGEDEVRFDKYVYTGNSLPFDNRDIAWQVSVSEKFIKNHSKDVIDEKRGKAIMFNVACESLKGNENMADIFEEKGFGAYFGYDEKNYFGQATYFFMLNKMLSGMSLENAYYTLHDSLKDEHYAYNTKKRRPDSTPRAVLKPKYFSKSFDIAKSRIIKPTLDIPDNTTENEEKLKLSGFAYFFSYYYKTIILDSGYIAWDWGRDDLYDYGFFISNSPDYHDLSQVKKLPVGDRANLKNVHVSFDYTLSSASDYPGNKITPNTTYYVWSYIYDGRDYYLSDMKEFTTGALSETSSGELPNIPGTDL